MLPDEVHDIGVIANEFWEKAREYEIVLLKKQIPSLDFEAVKAALEAARLASKYSTLPLQDINTRLQTLKRSGGGGGYITCYALNPLTGKNLEVAVRANSNEGAKVEMGKYLQQWGMEPTDLILYIGEESFDDFFNARHEVACQKNPKIDEATERIRKIGVGGLMMDVVGNLPEIPQKQHINVGVRVKDMTEAVTNIKDTYDPDIPDDCPF